MKMKSKSAMVMAISMALELHATDTVLCSNGTTPSTNIACLAVGASAQAASAGTALGSSSQAGAASVAVGYGATTQSNSGAGSLALGYYAQSQGSGIALGSQSAAIGQYSIALGETATTQGNSAVAIGSKSQALWENSVAIGFGSSTSANGVVSFGSDSYQRRLTNVAPGQAGTDAVNVMQLTAATTAAASTWVASNSGMYHVPLAVGPNAIAIGSGAVANGGGDIALGNGTVSNGANTISKYTSANGVVNGKLFFVNQTATNGSLAVGQRQITQVSDGEVSTFSTDAINGSQLFAVGSGLSGQVANMGANVATALGGGSYFNASTGAVGAPSYSLASINAVGASTSSVVVNSVGSALSVFNGNITNTASVAVKYDAIGGSQVTLGAVGGAGAPSRGITITNLAAGARPGDAVNFQQLQDLQSLVVNGLNSGSKYISVKSTGWAPYASGKNTISVEPTSSSTGDSSLALGDGATAGSADDTGLILGADAIAIGRASQALGNQSLSLGSGAGSGVARTGSLSIGYQSVADADNAVSLGYKSSATFTNSIALGAGSATQVGGLPSYIAYGLSGTRTSIGEVALGNSSGYRQVTGVAAGSADHDAVNVEQLRMMGTRVDALSSGSNLSPNVRADLGAIVVGPSSSAVSTTPNVPGITIGSSSQGTDGLIIGNSASVAGGFGIAIGNNTSVSGSGSVAIGNGSIANGNQVVSFGVANHERRLTNIAPGLDPMDAVNRMQLDNLGGEVQSLYDTAITYTSPDRSTLTLGNGTSPTAVSGVADGKSANDAVNVEQLNAVSAVASQASTSASHALTIANVVKSQADDLSASAVRYTLGQTRVDFGLVGTPVRLTNVASGTADSDAVNVGQLNDIATTASLAASSAAQAVRYDSPARRAIALGDGVSPVRLSNVDDAQNSADAVNLKQLNAVASRIGQVTAGTIQYSTPDASLLSFAGSAGTRLSNVATGTSPTDAVNLSQVSVVAAAANDAKVLAQGAADKALSIADQLGTLNSLAVTYVDGSRSRLTLGNGTSWVRLSNVANGVEDSDAVNVAQLRAITGQIGQIGASSIVYDDSSRSSVTLAGGGGTAIRNLRASGAAMDAATVGQIANVTAMFGGGASIDSSGTAGLPTYVIQGQSTHAVGSALSVIDTQFTSLQSSFGLLSNRVTSLEARAPGTGGAGQGASGVAIDGNGAPAVVAPGSNGVAIGSSASAAGAKSTAIGGQSYASGPGDIAVGANARVDADFGTAIGTDAHIASNAPRAVAVGAGSIVSAAGSIAIGSQATASGSNAVAVGAGSVANAPNTFSVGAIGQERTIVNVAAGKVGTDAANIQQLDSRVQAAIDQGKAYADAGDASTLQASKAYTDAQIKAAAFGGLDQFRQQVNDQFRQVDRRIDRTGAMSTAMSQMGVASAGAQGNGRIAAGVGYQGSSPALALGFATQLGDRVHVNLGGAFSRGDATMGAGIGIDL